MEVLPHFWIDYYEQNNMLYNKLNDKSTIIHLSKYESFNKKSNIEEIRIPIDYSEVVLLEDKNNIIYQHLFDITDFIHEKINNCQNILLIGNNEKQDIDTIIISYFIRYGRMTIQDSIIALKSKKNNSFNPKCLFYFALNRFYNEINKNY